MTGWRIARHEELPALWPAARSAHVAESLGELRGFYEAGPWRVRVSSAGDAMVLARWRAHLDSLAIRALWVSEHRVPELVTEARAVARAQGFGHVLTPLLARALHGPYERAGMREVEPIVALQGQPAHMLARASSGVALPIRSASERDIPEILALDASAFNEFWRYGPDEIASAFGAECVRVAECAGRVCAYATSTIRSQTCTLGRLAVDADFRRRGFGRALVIDAARWAAGRGVLLFSLCTQESNRASRALYASCGLTEVDERYGILSVEA